MVLCWSPLDVQYTICVIKQNSREPLIQLILTKISNTKSPAQTSMKFIFLSKLIYASYLVMLFSSKTQLFFQPARSCLSNKVFLHFQQDFQLVYFKYPGRDTSIPASKTQHMTDQIFRVYNSITNFVALLYCISLNCIAFIALRCTFMTSIIVDGYCRGYCLNNQSNQLCGFYSAL